MDISEINQKIDETKEKISNLSKQAINNKNNMKTTQSYAPFYNQIHILENTLKSSEKLKKRKLKITL